MKLKNLLKTIITFLVATGLFITGLFVFADWQPPLNTPPLSNVPELINVGGTAQEKEESLTVSTLTTSGGKIFANTGEAGHLEGDLFRVRNIEGVGTKDLVLKSDPNLGQDLNRDIHLAGSWLKFESGGSEKLTVDSDGKITKGRIPWQNLVNIPNSNGCSTGTLVTAITPSSITCSPGGGAISGGQNNYLVRWTTATSVATSVIYQTGNNLGIATTVPLAGFKVDVNGSVRLSNDLRLTKPGTPGDRQSRLIDCNGISYNLETDSDGDIICGNEEGGAAGGAPLDAYYLVYTSVGPGLPLTKARQLVTTTASSGLILNNPTSTASSVLSTDFNTIQRRITGECSDSSYPYGSSIRQINADGLVDCEEDNIGTGIGGSGSRNKVAFFTGSTTLTSNSNFHLDGWGTQDLRLGIGTSSPNSTLTVRRSNQGTAFAIRDTTNATSTFTISDSGFAYMTGFRLGTVATSSYVLTADNQGNGTWKPAPESGEASWWRDTSGLPPGVSGVVRLINLSDGFDRVGIGIDTPERGGPTDAGDRVEIAGVVRFHNSDPSKESFFFAQTSGELRSSHSFYSEGGLGYGAASNLPGQGLPNEVCTTLAGRGWFGSCTSDDAEYFPMKDVYRGNIVNITDIPNPSFDKDPETPSVASKSNHPYDEKMIGIVSTIGSAIGTPYDNNYQRLALSGRLPLIVSTETGSVSYGDPITSSSFKGIGMKATQKGPIVARAIDNFNPDPNSCELVNNIEEVNWDKETLWLEPLREDTTNEQPADPYADITRLHWTKKCFRLPNGTMFGKITVVVQNSFYDPDVYLTDTGNLKIIEDSNGNFSLVKEDGSLISQVAAFKELIVSQIQAGLIQTKRLIVNGVDILKKIGELEERNQKQRQLIREQDEQIEELRLIIEKLKKG